MRAGYWTLVLLAVLLSAAGCEGCVPGCFDPDDPCPNDMVSDETGCVWDRCAGDFTGEKLPCWFMDFDTAYPELAGSQGQYLAYVRIREAKTTYSFGEVWIYDLETGEHSQVVEEGRLCYDPQSDGDRIAWNEKLEEKDSGWASDVFVRDLTTGQEWHVPNPDRVMTRSFSLSGDRVVVVEDRTEECTIGIDLRNDIYLYDMETEEKSLVVEAEYGDHDATSPRLSGDRLVYWRAGGACGDVVSQLWLLDLASGQERMIDDLAHVMTAPVDSDNVFHFDGQWAVMWMGYTIGAYKVDSGQFVEVTRCSAGDCHTYFGNGLVAFDRHGDDGLDQHQLFVYSLESGAEQQLTFLRPYYDAAMPQSMLGRRLLWSETRGKSKTDLCGNEREATGRTALYFWKDIELD